MVMQFRKVVAVIMAVSFSFSALAAETSLPWKFDETARPVKIVVTSEKVPNASSVTLRSWFDVLVECLGVRGFMVIVE